MENACRTGAAFREAQLKVVGKQSKEQFLLFSERSQYQLQQGSLE